MEINFPTRENIASIWAYLYGGYVYNVPRIGEKLVVIPNFRGIGPVCIGQITKVAVEDQGSFLVRTELFDEDLEVRLASLKLLNQNGVGRQPVFSL